MIGPFTTAPGGFTHVLVTIDKFTKWIEYKPIAKLTPDRVVDFISDILHHFGFPNTIITELNQTSRLTSFGSSMKMRASRSNMSPLHTQGPMVKLKGRMA
jgi:hypothetical protein